MPSPRRYTAVAALVAAGAVAITTTTVLDRDDAAIVERVEVDADPDNPLIGDTVVEFEPGTGAIISEVSVFDLIDPLESIDRVVVPEWCGPYLQRRYPDLWSVHDWTHANAVVLDEDGPAGEPGGEWEPEPALSAVNCSHLGWDAARCATSSEGVR